MPALDCDTHTNIVTFTYRPARRVPPKSRHHTRPVSAHAEARQTPLGSRPVWDPNGVRYVKMEAHQIGRKAVAKIVKGQTHPNVRPAGHVKTLDKMAEVVAAQKRAAERDAEHQRKKQAHEAKAAQADGERRFSPRPKPPVLALSAHPHPRRRNRRPLPPLTSLPPPLWRLSPPPRSRFTS